MLTMTTVPPSSADDDHSAVVHLQEVADGQMVLCCAGRCCYAPMVPYMLRTVQYGKAVLYVHTVW